MASESGGSVVWNLDVDSQKLSTGLASAKKEVASAAGDIDKSLSGVGSNITKSITGAFKEAEDASRKFGIGLLGVFGSITAGLGFGVSVAAEIETARQGFTTLLGSVEEANAAIEQIKKDATQTPFEFSGLVRANQLLTSVTKDAGRSEKLLLNIGKALAAAGKGGEELDNVIVNLQQIANTGKITEVDIRQFGFAGINILELLADSYGVTKDAAGEMVKGSTDAFADLEASFEKAGGAGGRFERAFIDQAGTFAQLSSNFRDIVSQTAAEIVTSTGVFDAVKDAIGGIVDALVRFKPDIVEGIRGFLQFVTDNGPIIIGIVAGGLAPAFGALAASIGLAAIHLAPFILAGAALGFIIPQIVEALGGWENIQTRVNEILKRLGEIYNSFIKPSLDQLIASVRENLLPALSELWEIISPVLIPALKLLGTVFAGAVIVAIKLFIDQLRVIIDTVSLVIKAFSKVYDAIVGPFQRAAAEVKKLGASIARSLEGVNPFHRESPSLVDNVKAGVKEIIDQYKGLSDISLPGISNGGVDSRPALASVGNDKGFSGAGGNSSSQVITLEEVNVRDKSDINSLVTELGFLASVTPSISL